MDGRTDQATRAVPPPPPLVRHDSPPPPGLGEPGGAPHPGAGGRRPGTGRVGWIVAGLVLVVAAVVVGFVLVGGDGGDQVSPTTATASSSPVSTLPGSTVPLSTVSTTDAPVTSDVVAPTAATLPPITPVPTILDGTKVYPMEREPLTFDPADPRFVDDALARVFYESLFWYDPVAGEYVTQLVERYQVDTTASQAVWTLSLRPGVLFHDAVALDAAAVLANLERQRVAGAPGTEAIVATSAVDALTVRLTFGPAALDRDVVLALLSGPVGMIASPMAGDLAERPVGTGPFMLVEWVPGERIAAERFADYWRGEGPTDLLVFVAP